MALREEKVCVTSGKIKASVRRETNAVSSMRVTIVHQNRHRKPLHPLSHQHQEVEVRREKRATEAGVRLGRPVDSRGNTSCKVLAANYFVTIGILPNIISELGCKFGAECSFPHWKGR